MRALSVLLVLSAVARADDPEPFAARTSPLLIPRQHTHEATGTLNPVARYAVPGISRHESGGYVGGSKLVRGDGAGPQDGTFGWDYTGRRPGRFFLGWFHDSPRQPTLLPKYNTDGPRVTDVLALQPFKKAVREAKAEKRSGKED